MKPFLRGVCIVVLLGLTVFLFLKAQTAYETQSEDSSWVMVLFGLTVLVGASTGVVLVMTILPWFGDAVGNVVFQPNERADKNPHADAMAAMARGDYHKAIAEYERVYAASPQDSHALSEVARIYCEKLHEPEAAASVLEQALERDLVPEDAAFLCSRLADVYWNHQHDSVRARELLTQVIGLLPGTRHAANATHRLQEIERQAVMHS
jgi:cytochrome c-type biogenesis protein CcmH/NrfG